MKYTTNDYYKMSKGDFTEDENEHDSNSFGYYLWLSDDDNLKEVHDVSIDIKNG